MKRLALCGALVAGILVLGTAPAEANAPAAADQGTAQANVLIGNDSDQTGTTTITVNGFGSAGWLPPPARCT